MDSGERKRVVLFDMDWMGVAILPLCQINQLQTHLYQTDTMKSLLTVQIDPSRWLTVSETLSDDELGLLVKALAALMSGGDPMPHLTTSGLRIGFALLSEPFANSIRRQQQNRVNGAKGGRPRTNKGTEVIAGAGSPSVTSKKSKKEDLPPTPPIEEKNKKNILSVVDDALAREQFKEEVLNNDLRREQACASLHIDTGEYLRLVGEVLNEWEFADEQEWSYKHLLNTLRVKMRSPKKHKYHGTGLKNRCDITDTAAVSAEEYEGPF